MMKRLLALLLVLAMVVAYVPLMIVQVEAVENTTEFAGGSGTEADPYLISTKEHLNNVRYYPSAHFRMIDDIEFTDADFAEGGAFYNNGSGWEPIGYTTDSFSGVFDGNYHTVKNVYVRNSTDYTGFFGTISGSTASVKNLYLTGVDCQGSQYTGGLAGRIISASVTGCYINGTIQGTNYTGGVAGQMRLDATISMCAITGYVQGQKYVGGICGATYTLDSSDSQTRITAQISNCRNEATITGTDVVGGVVGSMDIKCAYETEWVNNTSYAWQGKYVLRWCAPKITNITNCYNIGSVNTTGTSGGGIVGSISTMSAHADAKYDGTIQYCYNAGLISNEAICPDSNNLVVDGCYYLQGTSSVATHGTEKTHNQMQTQASFSDWNFSSIWTMDGDADYPYPELRGVYWEKNGTCGDDLTWKLGNDGTLTISGTGAMTNFTFGESPWYGNASIKSVVIEEGVTSIGDDAFDGCTELTSVAIPVSVTAIGDLAFFECDSLTNVTYCGTLEQWGEISVGLNPSLTNEILSYHQWDVVTTEPTFVAMGQKVSTCVHCGEQVTETIPAKFYGTSVELGNTLDMYFAFYNRLVDEDGKVVFVREFADGTTETTEAPITSFNKNNSLYDITYTGLAAKEMCDTIHVYVYDGEGNLVGQHSDSIRSYILRQLREKDYEDEFRTLCVDLLNYGAAAQETFGYNTDDLANKDLTAEELAEGTQTIAEYKNQQTKTGNTDSYYGTAYILETQISMTMAVRVDDFDAGCYALVSYTDHTGTEKTGIRLEGVKNNSVYEFVLNEIVVADGRCLLTVEFYKADGTKVVTVQDSMESYTARNAAAYPLAEKMLAFSDSAYQYLHKNDE